MILLLFFCEDYAMLCLYFCPIYFIKIITMQQKAFTLKNAIYLLLSILIVVVPKLSEAQIATIVVSEINSDNQVELTNTGNEMVDVSSLWLCDFPAYDQLSTLSVVCGSLNMAPGDVTVVSGWTVDQSDGELGLYTSTSFASPTAIIDYVEWGSPNHTRSSVAVSAGIWTAGDFLPAFSADESLLYNGVDDSVNSWSADVPSLCTFNLDVLCDVEGGTLALADGGDEITICAGDGNSDAFDVTLTGNSGTNSAWVITDDAGNILALPPGPPFDLEGAGPGICLVWHLSFEDGLMGAEVGANANDLDGCFSLSNPITVTRNGVNGGDLAIANDGGDMITICAGDGESDAFDVTLENNEGTNSAWVITDDAGNILALPPSPPFDLDGAGPGICLVWHLSFEDGLTGAEVGSNASDLDGCFSLSNPITVVRNQPEGGTLALADGGDEITICAGDGNSDAFDVTLTGNSGTNSAWVITDDAGNILALPPGPPFDLEGAGPGICLVWHLSFEDGLMGAEVGANANDLDGCFSLSNPITVTRNGVNGGDLAIANDGGDMITICAGDGESDAFDVTLENNEGTNSAWVITDDAGNILALPPSPPFDLDGAGPGICLVWHLSFEDGLTGAEVGSNASDLDGCFSLSNPITVVRNQPEGGTLALADGGDEITICAGDGNSDAFDVTLTGNSGTNSAWVITDDAGNILALPPGPPFDLEGAGPGICLVWHLSFEDGLMGAEVGANANDLDGCFSLSNPITVTRNGVNGGDLAIANDGGDMITICAGDGESDAFDVTLENNEGTNSAWVITDDAGNILALPPSPPFDLDGAGPGICLVWHLSFEDGLTGAEVGSNASDLDGCFSLSNPITVVRNQPEGGTLALADGGDEITICAGDGNSDAFDVTLTGNSGTNSAWVITDDAGNILALPPGPPFDLEGAGPGICLVWHLSFEDGLMGAEVGANANDLDGCFSLSNPITVTRNGVNGGDLAIANDGGDMITICAGDGESDAFDVTLENNEGTNSAWVITDDAGNILALPPSPPFDLDGAGPGICLVWHLSFEDGLTGAEVGSNASDLDGCFSLSNPITVVRNQPEGGTLALADGGDEITICAGDGNSDAFDVTLTGNSGTNSAWVITDDAGNILALPPGPPFDLEGAGPGICLVWHLSFEDGLMGAEVGANANDLDGCFSLSNPITVTRNGVNGGDLAIANDGGDMITICAGDGESDAFDVTLENNEGTNSAWVITDDAGNILALPPSPPFDLDGAGPGICLVWHLSFEDGLTGAEVGSNASDLDGCFSLSNPITVVRNQPEGGTLALADGGDEITICAGDGNSDAFDVTLTGNSGTNSAWVITDDAGNILALPPGPPFDLEGAGPGICLVWHLSFEDGLMGAEVGANANDLDGCFSLSNPITVTRNGVNGGDLAIANDGGDMITICAGDGESDAFDVTLENNEGTNSAWVITDDAGNILALPPSPPFDLDGAGPGICLVWHLSFEDGLTGAEVGSNASDLDGCFSLSNPITVVRNQPEGGTLALADGGDEITICAGDGNSDAFDVTLTGNSGTNSAWVITDDAGNILALPPGPPFDLEGAGPGICLVWHLSFEDGLMGAEVGANANDLDGCFSLSNPITVTRNGVNGGDLAIANDGGDMITICAGDGESDAFDVTLENNEGTNSAWVITDDAGNILALPPSPPFDLDGAGPGICLVWHLSFEDGLTGAEVGSNASDLDGCFSLSNPITVVRNQPEGGTLALADGGDEITICAGDGNSDAFDVTLTGNSGTNSAWVITDDAGNILALPPGPPFDLEGAGPGICLVWHLSFEDGLMGAEVGANANDLDGCFSLSNPITVTRNGVNGGDLAIANDGGDMITICAGDGESDAFDVTLENNEGTNSAWVITDDAGNILALPPSPPFDLDGAGPGICLVWHLSFEDGLTGAEVGSNASDLDGCFSLSNPITVVRNQPEGGTLTGGPFTFCVGDDEPDMLMPGDITLEGNAGTNSAWVVTDEDGTILGLPDMPSSVDFNGTEVGICLVWHLSFEDGLVGAEEGLNANDLQGCFSLSNPVEIIRVDDGPTCISSTEEVNPASISFELWPNPVRDELNVRLDLSERADFIQLQITSVFGQIVMEEELENLTSLNNSVNVSRLPAGTYLLSIRTDKGISTQTFVRQ